jgi:hypothetical protein
MQQAGKFILNMIEIEKGRSWYKQTIIGLFYLFIILCGRQYLFSDCEFFFMSYALH